MEHCQGTFPESKRPSQESLGHCSKLNGLLRGKGGQLELEDIYIIEKKVFLMKC